MFDWIKVIFFWVVVAALFFYFYSADMSESSGYQKLKVATRDAGNGWVVRMKPEGWEVWKLEHKVETSKIFPSGSKLVTTPEAPEPQVPEVPVTTKPV